MTSATFDPVSYVILRFHCLLLEVVIRTLLNCLCASCCELFVRRFVYIDSFLLLAPSLCFVFVHHFVHRFVHRSSFLCVGYRFCAFLCIGHRFCASVIVFVRRSSFLYVGHRFCAFLCVGHRFCASVIVFVRRSSSLSVFVRIVVYWAEGFKLCPSRPRSTCIVSNYNGRTILLSFLNGY